MMVKAVEGFGLGQVEAMVRVEGGLSNDMWRVTATSGEYAVKVMRAHAEAADFRDNIEAAYTIERNAFREGIPCPEPMPTAEGHALLRADGHWLRAHRWCEGSSPNPGDHLEDAGDLLARIHRGGGHGVRALEDQLREVGAWAALADQPGLPERLSAQLRSAAPELARLEAATAASPRLVTTYADSHGDLDPKNTLVASGRLLAVDWDAAGPRPIAREAVSLALDWAENVDDFRRVLRAYASSSGTTLPTEAWVFGGWVAALCGWLTYNVQQRADSDLGLREASETCARLLALHRALDEHVSALHII
ncbi:phosphotransferase enzyme family protein [Brachybacterium sp. P6-10-X1]|uniref:phosphotransferase enzyme family protein n=1 Tax=Brachybacterium sp. P6-10-X1 TaxID=1903186 RepID=UPI0020A4FA80|nr:phosphotransferase [Brachybacterium sp. P6-10-X1]